MKNQIKLIIVCFISLIVFCLYTNNNTIKFSVPSGFYEEDFYLEITAPGSEIYYTLDGSDPTDESIQYTDPILITDASLNENVYSNIDDVSTYFLKDELSAYTNKVPSEIYEIPDYLIDKGTVIRVVYYDVFGEVSEVSAAAYFVGFEEKDGYSNINTISVVTDPVNLFDYDTGIYVLGSAFDEYLATALETGEFDAHYNWGANYMNTGSEWEREANITLFDTEGNLLLQKEVGIRVQGGASRTNYPKSLNVYARGEYDGTEQVEYSIWEDSGYIPDAFTISSGGNDIYTKYKDRLASELLQNLDVATLQYEPYNMFLNGEYWGVCNLAEKYTEDYFCYYYNVDPTNVTMIKAGELEFGETEDYESYQELYSFLNSEDLDLSTEEDYEYLWTQMDKSSTIDYFAAMLYLGRTYDWTPMTTNSAMWKTSYIGGDTYEDGKWRWAVYDMNGFAMASSYNDVDPIADTRSRISWFDSLCENEDFANLLADRLFELMEDDFQEEETISLIDAYIVEIEDAMANHYERFFGTDLTVFYEKMDDIKQFFEGRNENMEEFIYENFGDMLVEE